MADAALELREVFKSFQGTQVVKGLTLRVEQGEVFGLLGPNGAGKSTTINMISGLSRIDRGSIRVFGHDVVSEFALTRRLTGVMPQELVIDNFFKIDAALKIHAGYYGFRDDPQWRHTLVEKLSLGPHLKKKPIQLSGGMKRRLLLAKALLHKPRFLILDEPTAGVDVELRHLLWEFVRELNRGGTTILLTTHYLEEAEEMCGRVAIMNRGELVALDRPANLLRQLDERELRVKLVKPLGEVPAGLRAFQASLMDQGGTLAFKLGAHTPLNDLMKALANDGLEYTDLETRRADLEDVFLKLTSHRNAAPEAPSARKAQS
jgi:ABC-2 type transport system ATP-binding protein